jgi:hypothetical protein
MYHRFLLTAWLAPKESNINEYQMRRQYLFKKGPSIWDLNLTVKHVVESSPSECSIKQVFNFQCETNAIKCSEVKHDKLIQP